MSDRSLVVSLVCLGAGAFSLLGAWYDWDFFFNSRRAWLFVTLFGRTGARVFYALVGLSLIGLAAWQLLAAPV
ncbi:MAG TPA: immunity 17 family protein [Myxococcota bacterium]|nr:immunity 17 family protein [Myxococcota bacterium]